MRILFAIVMMVTLVEISAFSLIRTEKTSMKNMAISGDSLELDRLKYMNEVMASIKGKEKWPADSVFKNIKVIKGKGNISAEHFLWMMNWGWSAELGVSCDHCHIIGRWESDELYTKDIARGMWNMRVKINSEILPAITGKNYDTNPMVTCITCHRGKPIPTEQ
ncbi:MAG: photosynthetic reaction center cytochrome c subunit family protein [Saprospiraceae bacterium]